MLIRVFRGVIRLGAHDALLRELHDDLLPHLRNHPDVTYCALGLPWESSPDEYLVETHWRTREALAAFAGPDWEHPRLEEAEAELLVSVSAHHYVTNRIPGDGGASPPAETPVLSLWGVEIDGPRHRLGWERTSVHLAPREMSAMLALAAVPGRPVGSAALARTIWPGSVVVTAHDVRRVIHRLRNRLRSIGIPLTILNVHGAGYSLEPGART